MKSAIRVMLGIGHFGLAAASLLFLFGWAFVDNRFGARAIIPTFPLFGLGFLLIAIPGSDLPTNLIGYILGIIVAHFFLFTAAYPNAVGSGSEFPVWLTFYSISYFLALAAGESIARYLINNRKNENGA
jgi:hypothetical protein